jgi:hypothetical protein
MDARQKTTPIVGSSTERLNGVIGRRYRRLPKRLGGLSAVP